MKKPNPSPNAPSHDAFMNTLLEEIVRKKPGEPGDPGLLCLVPSALFAEECAHRLLDRCGSVAKVAFHTPSSLTRTLSEECGTPMLPLASRAGIQGWVGHRLRELEGERGIGPDLEEDLAYLRRFPKARRALVEAILLFRLHGCQGEEELPPSRGGRLLSLFLGPLGESLERAGQADPASRLATALDLLPGWFQEKGWVSLIALAAVPQSPEFLAFASCLQREGGTLVEEVGAEEMPGILPELDFFSAQGEEAETEEALERIRLLVEGGVRPDRIALSFVGGEPYLRLIEERAEGCGLPLRPTKGAPFRLTAKGRAGRNWLRFVLLDAPQELRAKVLFEPLLARVGSPAAAALDRAARDEGFSGGITELQSLLPGVPSEAEGREELSAFLRDAGRARQALLAAKDTRERCALLAEMLRAEGLLSADGEAPLAQTIQSLARSQDLIHGRSPCSLTDLARRFDELLEEVSLPMPQTAKEGIRVLPFQRMGVLDFDHVFVLGCLRGAWPRKPRPHPWLSSKDLEFLAQKHGERYGRLVTEGKLPPSPCPPQREEELERLRFHLLLRRCRISLCLSYPGVDLRAKPKPPSPWFEELRAAKGDTHPLRPFSASPEAALARRRPERVGLSALEAMTFAGFQRKDAALRRFAGRFPCVPPRGGDFIAQRDRFRPGQEASPYDALALGPSLDEGHPVSVTAFEDLGRCPLRFFFLHVLGLTPLPPEPSLDLVSALDRGSAVHRILQKVFEALISEGLFEPNELPRERCLELGGQTLGRLLRSEADRLMSRQFLRYPRLRNEVLALWGKSLEAQLELDLEELARTGTRPRALEKKLKAPLVFKKCAEDASPPRSRPLLLQGKYDRLDQGRNGRYRVLDYKTGKGARSIERKDVLQGRKTQLYLYQRLFLEDDSSPAGPDAPHPLAALRGVGPNFPISEERSLPEASLDEDFWEEPLRTQLEDSLATLVELLDQGSFPFDAEHGPCRHCDFAHACPRHHVPSQDRMDREPRSAAFRALQRKTPPRKKRAGS